MRGMKALATAGAFAFLGLRQLFLVRPHPLDDFLFVYQNSPTTPDGDRIESVFSLMENQIAQSVFRLREYFGFDAQSLFSKRMIERSDRTEEMMLGFQGGALSAKVHWGSDLDLWMTFETVLLSSRL